MYSEAQMKIDDARDQSALAKGLRTLNDLAKIMKQRRLEKGALLLASAEVRFSMEGDDKDPVDVELKQAYDTNSMVEVCAVQASCHAVHSYALGIHASGQRDSRGEDLQELSSLLALASPPHPRPVELRAPHPSGTVA